TRRHRENTRENGGARNRAACDRRPAQPAGHETERAAKTRSAVDVASRFRCSFRFAGPLREPVARTCLLCVSVSLCLCGCTTLCPLAPSVSIDQNTSLCQYRTSSARNGNAALARALIGCTII